MCCALTSPDKAIWKLHLGFSVVLLGLKVSNRKEEDGRGSNTSVRLISIAWGKSLSMPWGASLGAVDLLNAPISQCHCCRRVGFVCDLPKIAIIRGKPDPLGFRLWLCPPCFGLAMVRAEIRGSKSCTYVCVTHFCDVPGSAVQWWHCHRQFVFKELCCDVAVFRWMERRMGKKNQEREKLSVGREGKEFPFHVCV